MDVMNIGLREHRSASLRIAEPEGLPVEMRPLVREILSVKSENPGKGHATALMWSTVAEADKWWFTLLIQVRPFADGMTQEQLEKFYAKFGFSILQRDPCVLMVRSPQPPVIARIH